MVPRDPGSNHGGGKKYTSSVNKKDLVKETLLDYCRGMVRLEWGTKIVIHQIILSTGAFIMINESIDM